MADLVIPAGYGELVYRWQCVGRANPVTTTMGVRVIEPSTPQEVVDDAFDDISETGAPAHAGNMNHIWTFEGVEGKFNEAGTIVAASSSGTPIAGTVSGTGTPTLNTSMLFQKRTILVGRHYRGRCYYPCTLLDESSIDPVGNIESTEYGILNGYMQGWADNMFAATSYQPAILHHDATVPTDISSFVLSTKVATQRRRMR